MELSRTARKKQVQQLEQLALALVALPAPLPLLCPEQIGAQIRLARGMKAGARKRQLKFVTKLLKTLAEPGDIEALYRFVGEHQGGHLAASRSRQLAERYRNALVDEALVHSPGEEEGGEQWQSKVIQEMLVALPGLDGRELARLAYLFAATRNPRHSREIFRVIKAALAERERGERGG